MRDTFEPSNQPSCVLMLNSNQDDDEFRLQLANDWIQQERFNIQEAFTNQTKKIQADFLTFLERLDQELEVERQKLLSSYSEANHVRIDQRLRTSSSLVQVQQKQQNSLHRGNQQLEKQFKSNAKRHMLVHTAPVVDPSGASRGSSVLKSLNFRSSSSNNRRTDVSEMQQQLDQLQAQTQAMKEVRDICVG